MVDVLVPLRITLYVACSAALLVSVFGTLCAWRLAGRHSAAATLADYLLTLPLFFPPTVLGYALVSLLGRSAPLGRGLAALSGGSFLFTPFAAILAASLAGLPLFYRTVRSFMESIDPDIREAARVDGAGTLHTMRYILLPLVSRGLAVGFILVFLRGMGEFGITMMIAGNIPGKTQTISLAIWDSVMSGHESRAAALAGTLSALSLLLLTGYALLSRNEKPLRGSASATSTLRGRLTRSRYRSTRPGPGDGSVPVGAVHPAAAVQPRPTEPRIPAGTPELGWEEP